MTPERRAKLVADLKEARRAYWQSKAAGDLVGMVEAEGAQRSIRYQLERSTLLGDVAEAHRRGVPFLTGEPVGQRVEIPPPFLAQAAMERELNYQPHPKRTREPDSLALILLGVLAFIIFVIGASYGYAGPPEPGSVYPYTTEEGMQ